MSATSLPVSPRFKSRTESSSIIASRHDCAARYAVEWWLTGKHHSRGLPQKSDLFWTQSVPPAVAGGTDCIQQETRFGWIYACSVQASRSMKRLVPDRYA